MSETYVSISQFSNYIKNIFDAEIMLHHIFLYGEIGSYNVSNNIAYFTLKDEDALLNCVLFGASAFERPAIGDMVLVQGSPNYYVKGGRFSFQVTHMEPYGKGKLYEEFLKLKEKLEKLGYFDVSTKKQIPKNIKRMGVVTSKEGAVIQDIINVTKRRNPTIDIVLYPVKVQGIGAEQEIVEGINYFSNYGGVDCVVVARGGGSAEDLQAYNTEAVAHAVHNCSLPIISAVGHETDYSICDFCSDLRVPTPSAAAEIIAWDWYDRIDKVESNADMLVQSMNKKLQTRQERIENAMSSIISKIRFDIEKTSSAVLSSLQTLDACMEKKYHLAEHQVNLLSQKLESLAPQKWMARGYVKLMKDNQLIKSVKNITKGDELKATLVDGVIKVEVK